MDKLKLTLASVQTQGAHERAQLEARSASASVARPSTAATPKWLMAHGEEQIRRDEERLEEHRQLIMPQPRNERSIRQSDG